MSFIYIKTHQCSAIGAKLTKSHSSLSSLEYGDKNIVTMFYLWFKDVIIFFTLGVLFHINVIMLPHSCVQVLEV